MRFIPFWWQLFRIEWFQYLDFMGVYVQNCVLRNVKFMGFTRPGFESGVFQVFLISIVLCPKCWVL